MVATELDNELDRIFVERDRDHMEPTIAALEMLYAKHPTNARMLYELAGAYDTAGQEETALPFYERAMAAGLSGDLRRRCFVQYGSTLRNVGRLEDSLRMFQRARDEFPGSASLAAFESLTLHAAGQPHAAVAALLSLIVDHVDAEELQRYKPALRGNAEYIAALGD